MLLRIFALLLCVLLTFGNEPNPPIWPVTVLMNPSQEEIDLIYSEQGGHEPPNNGEWSTSRYAMLFTPGSYEDLTINIGYYTTLMGTGKHPSSVQLGNVICENGDFDYNVGALNNFWRSIENFETTPTTNSMIWAVSQASPMRRVIINGNLQLWQYNEGCCAGYASGGYISDSIVNGIISSGSQQQFFIRNTNMNIWDGGVWNMVFAGCIGAPETHCSNNNGLPITNINNIPRIAEKPYIYFDPIIENRYYLQIPQFEINKIGASVNYGENDISIDFENVYVTNPFNDNSDTINAKIISGINYIVITPGIYNIESPIIINRNNMVILGLGMATLIATQGNIIIQISDNIDGIRVAGLILDAGPIESNTLLSVGTMKGYLNNKYNKYRNGYKYSETNPTILYDIFIRVGGANNVLIQEVKTKSMIEIYNDYTICDDPWLWRADHDINGIVINRQNPVETGLIVYGNNVITYGLASEHTLGDLVQWNGNNGSVYFYQSELPYDVSELNYGIYGYCSFRIGDNVINFNGFGMGVYSYFRDHIVWIQNGILTPNNQNIKLENSLAIFLNGYGGIRHVINNQGEEVNVNNQAAYVCNLNMKNVTT
eukprot:193804_1